MNEEELAILRRQIDDSFLRRMDYHEERLLKIEMAQMTIAQTLKEMRKEHAQESPAIATGIKILQAGWLLKWAVTTVVVLCAGFATIVTAIEIAQRWLQK